VSLAPLTPLPIPIYPRAAELERSLFRTKQQLSAERARRKEQRLKLALLQVTTAAARSLHALPAGVSSGGAAADTPIDGPAPDSFEFDLELDGYASELACALGHGAAAAAAAGASGRGGRHVGVDGSTDDDGGDPGGAAAGGSVASCGFAGAGEEMSHRGDDDGAASGSGDVDAPGGSSGVAAAPLSQGPADRGAEGGEHQHRCPTGFGGVGSSTSQMMRGLTAAAAHEELERDTCIDWWRERVHAVALLALQCNGGGEPALQEEMARVGAACLRVGCRWSRRSRDGWLQLPLALCGTLGCRCFDLTLLQSPPPVIITKHSTS